MLLVLFLLAGLVIVAVAQDSPKKPKKVHFTCDNNELRLAWKAGEGAKGFIYALEQAGAQVFKKITKATEVWLAAGEPGVEYVAKVRSKRGDKRSKWVKRTVICPSAQVAAVPTAAPTQEIPPPEPRFTRMECSRISRQIHVEWQLQPSNVLYHLEIYELPNSLPIATWTSHWGNMAGITPAGNDGKTYRALLTASDGNVRSRAVSTEHTCDFGTLRAPKPPIDLSLSCGENSELILSWRANPSGDIVSSFNYKLYENGRQFDNGSTAGADNRGMFPPTWASGRTYRGTVRAYNDAGYSDWATVDRRC
ncbi:MAG: fibronectin type III domain-containing protein [Chloroflexi bacterium]|nr:fibronectin type III domain-containing protein [Chloroflexota bacterium]